MADSNNKSNSICRQILDTKEVTEAQVLFILASDDSLNSLSLDEKRDLSLQIKARFTQQFDSLLNRIQKELS